MSTPADAPLDVDEVDLESLILARNDTHPDGDWWFDPRSGASLYYGLDDDTDLPDLVDGVHVLVPRDPQPRTDVDDFLGSAAVDGLEDDEVARLVRASRGKAGLRRFRDAVVRTPAADAWSSFTLGREAVRAIDWLLERGLVEPAGARARRSLLVEQEAAGVSGDGDG